MAETLIERRIGDLVIPVKVDNSPQVYRATFPEIPGFQPKYQNVWMGMGLINVFVQPRKTFDNIPSLAQSIADKEGKIQPSFVARYSEDKFWESFALFNSVRNIAGGGIDPIVAACEDGQLFFYCLIDGGRRYKAEILLKTVGCSDCQSKYGEVGCYERHIGTDLTEARLYRDPPLREVIEMQYHANLHEKVRPAEEAEDLVAFYKAQKALHGGEYPKARFEREVGRSVEVLDRALDFAALPSVIIDLAQKNKKIPYGYFIHLAKYRASLESLQCPPSVEDMIRLLDDGLLARMKVEDFDKKLKGLLEQRRMGQLDLFDVFGQVQAEVVRRDLALQNRRLVVAAQLGDTFRNGVTYFGHVLDLAEEGRLEEDCLPFNPQRGKEPVYSAGAPANLMSDLVKKQERVLPILKRKMREVDAANAEQVVPEVGRALKAMVKTSVNGNSNGTHTNGHGKVPVTV